MTDAEISSFGADMAVAIRARGQMLADIAGDTLSADFLRQVYDDAAQVVELRTQLKRIGSHEARRTNDRVTR